MHNAEQTTSTKRSAIPGWVYIILGIAIIAYSKFIESKSGSNLLLFIIVGGAFVVWGCLREFIPRLRTQPIRKELVSPPKNTVEHPSTHLHPAGNQQHGVSHHATHAHVQPQQHPSHPYTPQHKGCPRCHQMTHGQARYCHNCGFQFY